LEAASDGRVTPETAHGQPTTDLPLEVRDRASSDARCVLALIVVVAAAARVSLGAELPLSVDEAYAVVMARRFGLSYFDHPPMAFWWVGLATRLARSESPVVVRLPFIAAFTATTWLLYRLGRFLFGERAGLWSAVLLNLSLFLSMSAGGWALPDGPLLLFSAAAALCLAHATIDAGRTPGGEASRGAEPGSEAWWTGFGICAGLALLSKYHAILLIAGAGVYLLTSRERAAWLRRPEPYVAAACAAVIFLPVIAWNAENQWASFRFQTGRAIPLEEMGGTTLLDSIAGQAAWILPWIWIPLLCVLVAALWAGPRDTRRWLLVCLASGPIIGFTLLTAIGSRGLPHWQAPGYFIMIPLLGAWVVRASKRAARWARRWLWASAVMFVLVVVALASHARSGWLRSAAPALFMRGDPTDDLLDWAMVAQQLRAWGFPRPGALIAAARWDDAAKMALAMGPEVAVGCVGEDARGFAAGSKPADILGQDIALIVRRRPGPEPMVAYAGSFDHLQALGSVPINRGGREEVTISVYLGHRLRRVLPLLQRR
jgi:hypothetical protein